MGARAVNAVLGFWLFLSAFLWRHEPWQFHNAWMVGTLVVTAALAGLGGARWGRHLNAALGGWLIVTSLGRFTHDATFWNHLLVGFGLVLFGLARGLDDLRGRRPMRVA